ncbi:hypothetical protein [Klebsiella michiganensis]|uniref:hypothetical protein n=1 Tax=Klebsiella michiganensis TaxID=1134687 RepID=UPI00255AEB67|nr:hypothetical protein [Klebsiella michiganensis]MDL4445120.1 hypothetical protein [Klebsiella michiganensis]MDL4485988.1 hypothetical protein [Klebsiella michiganensis]MDL4660827.1 hypothetical protein [Klebsiella michiganensis]
MAGKTNPEARTAEDKQKDNAGAVTGVDVTTGDGAATGSGDAAGDGTETGADGADGSAGDAAETGGDIAPVESWVTVQVVRSPAGKRIRGGIEFTTTPTQLDFLTLTQEQREKIMRDPYLRVKPYTPAEE